MGPSARSSASISDVMATLFPSSKANRLQTSIVRDDSARLESDSGLFTGWLSRPANCGELLQVGPASSSSRHLMRKDLSTDSYGLISTHGNSLPLPKISSWRSSGDVLDSGANAQKDISSLGEQDYHLSNPLPASSLFWSVQSADTEELEVERSSHGINMRCHYKMLGFASPPVFGLKSLQVNDPVIYRTLPTNLLNSSSLQERESSTVSSSAPSGLIRTRSMDPETHPRSPLHASGGSARLLNNRNSRTLKGTLGHASGLEATLGTIVGATHACVHAANAVRASPKLKRVLARSQRFTTHRVSTDLNCQLLRAGSVSLRPEQRCDSITETYSITHATSSGCQSPQTVLQLYDMEQSSDSHSFSSSFIVPQTRSLPRRRGLDTSVSLPGQAGHTGQTHVRLGSLSNLSQGAHSLAAHLDV